MAKAPKTPKAEPVKGQDTADAVQKAADAAVAAIDAGEIDAGKTERREPSRMKAMVCMPVIYRDDREHNGQADLAAIITGLPGEDAHGAMLACLNVTPPLGAAFWLTAPQWDGDPDEQPARTWRFVF